MSFQQGTCLGKQDAIAREWLRLEPRAHFLKVLWKWFSLFIFSILFTFSSDCCLPFFQRALLPLATSRKPYTKCLGLATRNLSVIVV